VTRQEYERRVRRLRRREVAAHGLDRREARIDEQRATRAVTSSKRSPLASGEMRTIATGASDIAQRS